MRIRQSVLRRPEGVRPESITKAQEVLQSFARHLEATGSVSAAAKKTTTETGTRADVKDTKKDK